MMVLADRKLKLADRESKVADRKNRVRVLDEKRTFKGCLGEDL